MPGRWTLWRLVAAGGLLLLTACADGSGDGGLSPATGTDTAIVVMQPHLEFVQAGDVVDVTVYILDAVDAVSTPFKLRYNPQGMEFVEGVQGPFLAQAEAPVAFLAGVSHQDPGEVSIGLTILGGTEGVSGDGELCRLRFRILPRVGNGNDFLTLAPFASQVFAAGLREMPSEFRSLTLRYRVRGER
jgi:hypothetical protein